MSTGIDFSDYFYFFRVLAKNSKKLLDRSVDTYNSILQLDPREAQGIHFEMGASLERKGDYPGAIRAYEKILVTEPDNVSALFKIGRLYIQLCQLGRGLEVLKKVTQLDTTFAEAFYLLGSAHFSMDENEEALEALKRSIELIPGNAEAYYKLGLIYDAMQMTNSSIDAYQKAITFKPDFVRAYQSLGFAYEAKGMRDEAVKNFKKSLELAENGV
jgi:tetratricopeptide (TPR) repeat protein